MIFICTDKTTTTLFTPDPAEYSTTLLFKLNNQTLPTTKYPTIFETTLDPKTDIFTTYKRHHH